MKINFYSTFRECLGVSSIKIDLPTKTTVKRLVEELLLSYPNLQPFWLDKQGELYGHVHISINQVDVMAFPDKMDTQVSEDDVIDFYPPITGG